MLRFAAILLLSAAPALAQSGLSFDTAKLCAWQSQNNAMDAGECTRLEQDAENAIPALEAKADAARKAECFIEATDYSGDSGFASHLVYAECLKNGPGGL